MPYMAHAENLLCQFTAAGAYKDPVFVFSVSQNPVSRYRTSVGKRSGGMKGRFRRRQRFGYNFKRHTGNLAPEI